jgi:hypothetical protein
MTKKSLGYVELEWTCPRCHNRNPGTHEFCSGCGGPMPEDVEFEQPLEEKFLTDADKIARAKAGPDRHCPYCNARNRGDAKFCGGCGGDLSEAAVRKAGKVLGAHRGGSAGTIRCPSCNAENPASARKCASCGASLADTRAKKDDKSKTESKPMSSGVIIGVALFFLVACIGLIVLLTRTESLVGQVQSVSWTRSIPILALGEVEDEAFYDEIPSNAEVGNCTLELYNTYDEPVAGAVEVCGEPYTVDTGSGVGEVVQDCVYELYEEYCSYTVPDWIEVDMITSSGANLDPYWPTVSLLVGQQEGEGTETYEIIFIADDERYTYTTESESEFGRYEIGSSWNLKVNTLGAVVSVEK